MRTRVHFRHLFSETGAARFSPIRPVRIRDVRLEPGCTFGEGKFIAGLELAAFRNYDLDIEDRPEEVVITGYYPRAY
jgi:hypothetical protein